VVQAVAAMADGKRFLSGSWDQTVRVWHLDGTLENTFRLHTGDVYANRSIAALVAMPDNQHALSASVDETVKLFNVNDGAVIRTFTHAYVVLSMALLPDGLRFVCGGTGIGSLHGDGTVTVAYHGLAFNNTDPATASAEALAGLSLA